MLGDVSGGYRALFVQPQARRLVAASASARVAIGAFTLPFILTAEQATGSFAVAGVVAGAFSLGVTVAAPVRGRLVDRLGARTLPPLAAASGSGLAAIA